MSAFDALGIIFSNSEPVTLRLPETGEKTLIGKFKDRASDVFLGENLEVVTDTVVTFDATTSEVYNHQAMVTAKTIEIKDAVDNGDGFLIPGSSFDHNELSDNRVLSPEKISITAIVSDTRMSDAILGSLVGNVQGIAAKVRDLSSTFGGDDSTDKAGKAAYDKLVEFHRSGALLTLATGLETVDGMWITNLTVPRNVGNDGAEEFTISLEKPQFAVTDVGKFDTASVAGTPGTEGVLDGSISQGGKDVETKVAGSGELKDAVEDGTANKTLTLQAYDKLVEIKKELGESIDSIFGGK